MANRGSAPTLEYAYRRKNIIHRNLFSHYKNQHSRHNKNTVGSRFTAVVLPLIINKVNFVLFITFWYYFSFIKLPPGAILQLLRLPEIVETQFYSLSIECYKLRICTYDVYYTDATLPCLTLVLIYISTSNQILGDNRNSIS